MAFLISLPHPAMIWFSSFPFASHQSLLSQVDVVEPHGKVVKLGALSVGQTVKKTVTIANNSVAPLTFKLCFMPIVPELQEDGVRPLPSLENP